ncbi:MULTISPECIES: DnaJ family domain-containing protein [unclassified Nonomuraea]|uniref:DnaJ family domain-containing protein n=1 Tax=Nonomuraea sp. NPDC047529 TaxID=3155623 RepID=UPI003406F65B
MTDRKPVGMPFESWVDRQIREATERGEFDDLPGAGKPLPGLDRPHDEMWWIKQKLESEGLSLPLPPTLALRKEAEEVLRQARGARSETEVRQLLEEVNEKIRDAIRRGLPGPPLNLMPFDVERVVSEWRESR